MLSETWTAVAAGAEQAALAEGHRFHGAIVGKHGHDDVAAGRVGGMLRLLRARLDQRPRLVRAAVPHGQPVARPEQIAGDRGAHLPKPDEADLHNLSSHALRPFPVPTHRLRGGRDKVHHPPYSRPMTGGTAPS